MQCKMSDCFKCPYDDCINDHVRIFTPEQLKRKKEYMREHKKKRRDEARANGICTECFKKEATHGVLCYECWLRQRKYDRTRMEKHHGKKEFWRENGLCYLCGNPLMEGHKVCEKHYKMRMENFRKCREKNPRWKGAAVASTVN